MRKIVSTTKINSGFLAIVLIVGTFAALSPSFMIGAHAQQYGMDKKYNSYEPDYGMNSHDNKQSYGKDSNNYYYKSKDSSRNVKCHNINANLNGDIDIGASQALDALATDEAQADEGQTTTSNSAFGNGERNNNGYQHNDKDFRFVCINNNNNEQTNPPDNEDSNLVVNKAVSCQRGDNSGQSAQACRLINSGDNGQPLITPDDFTITITGNNPIPSQSDGSVIPVIVNLEVGGYQVSETADPSLAQTITNIEQGSGTDLTQSVIFSGDCDAMTGEGTIAEGDLQICSLENVFTATIIPPG